jgi:uncharacterized membrane protein YhhN
MRKILIVAFCVVSSGDVLALLMSGDTLHRTLKPFIMITIGGYYLYSVRKEGLSIAVLGAIFLSWLGDVLLLFSEELYFKSGLSAFLLAHICYIISYRQHKKKKDDALMKIQKVRFSLPIILAGTGLMVVLWPHLDEFRLPVFLYAVVLIIMTLNALFRYGHTTLESFWLVFVGAILFMVSDSILAIGKFIFATAHFAVFIMATYIVAQFLIIEGLIRHCKDQTRGNQY